MAELSLDAFKKAYGHVVPAIIQIAFVGDVDHRDNLTIEAAARKVKFGDVCILDGYIVFSRFEAVAEVSLMLPKTLMLENVIKSLMDKAQVDVAVPRNLMKSRGYAQPPKQLHPQLEFNMMQYQFKQNTGFQAEKIFNALRRKPNAV